MPIKFACPYTGIGFQFFGFDALELQVQSKPHPAIETLTHHQFILRQAKFSQQKFLLTLNPTELTVAAASLLSINPLIDFHHPIDPAIETLRDNFSRLYFATGFIRTLKNPEVLPHYSITKDTSNLVALFDGWLTEVEDEKNKIRKRYREEVLSRMEERYTKRLRNKIFGGKTLFHQLVDYKVLEWLFERMDIPQDDWDGYRKVLYNDIWENLRTPECALRLLELEGYLESWYSLGSHKPIIHRRIHAQLSEFLDMGGSLPPNYYTKSADGDIESPNFGNQDSFRKVIKPKLVFSPVFAPKAVKAADTKPDRKDFASTVAYAKALLDWNRKNNLG
jgi:hypothetical protein